MVWGLEDPNNFGECFPSGDYVGWEEKVKRHFDEEMSDAQKALYDNWDVNYRGEVARKFVEDLGPVASHERPTEFKVREERKSLGSMIELTGRLLAVSEPLMKLIETFEPDVHQFWPMQITTSKGKEYPVPYYGFVIRRFIDSFIPDQSECYRSTSAGSGFYISERNTKKVFSKLAVSQRVSEGFIIWRESKLVAPNILISDDFQKEIARRELSIFKHNQLKAV